MLDWYFRSSAMRFHRGSNIEPLPESPITMFAGRLPDLIRAGLSGLKWNIFWG